MKKQETDRLIELYIKGMITKEEFLRAIEKLEKKYMKEPPIIY